jgi:hypothetical protein
MQVTRRPQALRTTPTLLAVTPLPSPLTTPPVISTYLVAAARGCSPGGEDMRPEEGDMPAGSGGEMLLLLRFRGEKGYCSSKRTLAPCAQLFVWERPGKSGPGMGLGLGVEPAGPGSGL